MASPAAGRNAGLIATAFGLITVSSAAIVGLTDCDRAENPKPIKVPQTENGKPPVAPKHVGGCPQLVPPAPPSAGTLPPATGGRVVLDLSGSVAGFAKANGAALAGVHQAIKNALSASSVGATDYCDLNGTEQPVCGLPAAPQKYQDARTYAAKASNLAVALAPRKQPKTDGANAPASASFGVVDDRAVTVVVTDGLEASQGTARDDLVVNCQPGADTFCLRDVLVARAKQGYAISIVAVSLPFSGSVFAERGVDLNRFAEIQPRLDGLRKQPGWDGIELGAKALKKGAESKNHFYQYKGVRPLVMVVLARDAAVGRKVTDDLVAQLRVEKVAIPANRLESVIIHGYQPATYAFGPAAKTQRNATAARNLLPLGQTKNSPAGVSQRFECHERTAGDYLKFSLAPGESAKPAPLPDGLQSFAEVQFVPTNPKAFVDYSQGPGQPAAAYSVAAVCKALNGKPATATAVVSTGLRFVPGGQTGWWHQWSAIDTYSQPENVYLLAGLVDALLQTAAVPAAPRHCLAVTLQPAGE